MAESVISRSFCCYFNTTTTTNSTFIFNWSILWSYSKLSRISLGTVIAGFYCWMQWHNFKFWGSMQEGNKGALPNNILQTLHSTSTMWTLIYSSQRKSAPKLLCENMAVFHCRVCRVSNYVPGWMPCLLSILQHCSTEVICCYLWSICTVVLMIVYRCCESFWTRCRGKPDYKPRSVYLARPSGPTDQKFPANIIRNQKYSIITFIPLVSHLLYVSILVLRCFVFVVIELHFVLFSCHCVR